MNLTTGEIVDFRDYLIINKASARHYRKMQMTRKEIEIENIKDNIKENKELFINWKMNSFVMVNDKEINLLVPDLTGNECKLLLSLLKYVNYQDSLLRAKNGKDLNIEKIALVSGFSLRTTTDLIKSLIGKDVMYKGKNSKNVQYFLNPWLIYKGNTISKVLKSMFKNYYIRSLGVKWGELEK